MAGWLGPLHLSGVWITGGERSDRPAGFRGPADLSGTWIQGTRTGPMPKGWRGPLQLQGVWISHGIAGVPEPPVRPPVWVVRPEQRRPDDERDLRDLRDLRDIVMLLQDYLDDT